MNEAANTEELFSAKLEKHLYHYYWEQLGLKDWRQRIEQRKNEVSREEQILRTVESFTGPLLGRKVLVVGSGWGGSCVAAKRLGAETVIGIDIDEDVNEVANLRMKIEGLAPCCYHGEAEALPFESNSFDYVHCFTVLEHVSDVARSLAEMVRVVRPGGHVFIQAPNYLRPVERHYKLLFPPLLPKRLARLYLRLRGKPTLFIDSINYIRPCTVRRDLKLIPGIILQDIGRDFARVLKTISSTERDGSQAGSEKPPASPDKASLPRQLSVTFARVFSMAWDTVFRTREIHYLIQKIPPSPVA